MYVLKHILIAITIAIYVSLGYFVERTNFTILVLLFSVAFFGYLFLTTITNDKKATDQLLWWSMLFRAIFIVSIPILSDDYFRFLWDAKLFIHGYNPYLLIPSDIINTDVAQQASLNSKLYEGLNSPDYYTVYPPISQLLFALGGLLAKYGTLWGVLAMRIPLLVAEFFTIKYIRIILARLKISQKNVLWYALNPLVIVELSGNLHYEGIMLLCLLISIYWLMTNRWAGSAVWWAMAVSIKLIPLLFLPLVIRRLGLFKGVLFCCITVITLLFTFLPFLDQQLIQHFFSSIDLYFRTFEFNASIYYLVRWTGFQYVGYNIIQKAGPIMALITFVLIMAYYSFGKITWSAFLKKMLFAYTIYLLMASIVHPWYIINLVLLSAFVPNFKYAVLWSFMAILSYFAYSNTPYQESSILLWTEYSIVIAVLLMELFQQKTNKKVLLFQYRNSS